MNMEIIIRCENCGKVLKGTAQEACLMSRCPRCQDTLEIPAPMNMEARQYYRAVVGEKKWITSVPYAFRKSNAPAVYKVMYTEVPPADFIQNRSTHVPLLDLNEGGMGLFVNADKVSDELQPSNTFIAEIDFPILVQPLIVRVEVRWIRPIKEKKLIQMGVMFCDMNESLRNVILSLKHYIESRTNEFDFDKWGAFA